MVHIIYQITNEINKKIYIGRSKLGIAGRWKAHLSRLKGGLYAHLRLYRALAKYGPDHFSIKQIEVCPDFETAQRREGETILATKSYLPEIGYNMALDTGRGIEFLSEESITKRRIALHHAHFSKAKLKNGLVGVSKPHSGSKLWRVSLRIGGKKLSYSFPTREEAARFYDLSSLASIGSEASLNYEENRSEYLKLDLVEELEKSVPKNRLRSYPVRRTFLGIIFHVPHQKWGFSVYSPDGKRCTETTFETEEDAYNARLEFLELNPSYAIQKPARKSLSQSLSCELLVD